MNEDGFSLRKIAQSHADGNVEDDNPDELVNVMDTQIVKREYEALIDIISECDLDLEFETYFKKGWIEVKDNHVEYLNLSVSKLTKVPYKIQHFNKIQHLHINYNKISEIPDFFYDMDSIVSAEFRNNDISEISTEIKKMKNLKYIGLSSTALSKIPYSILEETSFKIDLRYNEFSEEDIDYLRDNYEDRVLI